MTKCKGNRTLPLNSLEDDNHHGLITQKLFHVKSYQDEIAILFDVILHRKIIQRYKKSF